MDRLKISLMALLAAHLPIASPSAAAAETPLRVDPLTWLSAHPPATSEAQRKARLNDTLVDFMREQWPQIEHKLVQANAKRSWQMIAQGEPVCLPAVVRTPEREGLAYFTSTLLSPPPQLIVRRDKVSSLPRSNSGEVELPRLLADTRLHGALIEGRSYGLVIDDLLARRSPGTGALTLYAASDFGSKLLPMMALGRLDYTIEYEMVLNTSDSESLVKPLQTLPIQGASEPVVVGIACPRNPWGMAAITRIDQVLGTPAGSAMLRRVQERLMTPESRQHYEPQLNEFYKERTKPSVIR